MNARASADVSFYRRYVKVFHMVVPPTELLNPRMLASTLLGSKKPLSRGPAVRAASGVTQPSAASDATL
jgi:hypothetical protein